MVYTRWCLKSRLNDFSGILNGIDYDIYNPETDPLIEKNFNSSHFAQAKKKIIKWHYLKN